MAMMTLKRIRERSRKWEEEVSKLGCWRSRNFTIYLTERHRGQEGGWPLLVDEIRPGKFLPARCRLAIGGLERLGMYLRSICSTIVLYERNFDAGGADSRRCTSR